MLQYMLPNVQARGPDRRFRVDKTLSTSRQHDGQMDRPRTILPMLLRYDIQDSLGGGLTNRGGGMTQLL